MEDYPLFQLSGGINDFFAARPNTGLNVTKMYFFIFGKKRLRREISQIFFWRSFWQCSVSSCERQRRGRPGCCRPWSRRPVPARHSAARPRAGPEYNSAGGSATEYRRCHKRPSSCARLTNRCSRPRRRRLKFGRKKWSKIILAASKASLKLPKLC